MRQRLAALRQFLSSKQLDGIVVSKSKNRCYFSGFTGSSGYLLVTADSARLITDFRYIEQAGSQAEQFEVIRHGSNGMETIGQLITQAALEHVGFESAHLTYDAYHLLQQQMPNVNLQPVQLDHLRMIKDDGELALIQTAVEIADAAFTHILTVLRPGITELAVAAELEFYMRRQGAERPAFATIVASGVRGALPHGIASEKVIQAGELVTMDFGAVYRGYHSDITRTVCVGKASDRQQEIYNTVLAAQLAGLAAVQAGRAGRAVDAAARELIAAAGYGECFGHGLGHGVGLAIHEGPTLSPNSADDCLAEQMVVTVEPGIYLPQWGGVRIEDTVVVRQGGCDILTASTKQLLEIS